VSEIGNFPRHFIREWRKHRGLTQAELARTIDIDRTHLNKVERGTRRCSAAVMGAIAAKLDCRPENLASGPPADSSEFAALYYSLTEEDRARALRVLKTVFRR
jgi:transcriptional regulator with XRE-family HTH domain